MGSIQKRGNNYRIRYDVEMPNGRRKQKSISGFKTEKEAENALKIIEAKTTLGLLNESLLETVNDVMTTWLNEHVINLAPQTIQYYYDIYSKHILPYSISSSNIKDLKVGTMTRFFQTLKNQGVSDGSIYRIRNTLRSAFFYCYEQEYIESKFMDKVKVKDYAPKKVTDRQNYWTPEMIEMALPFLKDSPIYLNICLALNLGLRAEETAGLRDSDLNFKEDLIIVRHALNKLHRTKEIMGEYIEIINEEEKIILKELKGHKSLFLPMTQSVRSLLLKKIGMINDNKMLTNYNHQYNGFLSVYNTGDIITEKQVSQRWREVDMPNLQKELPDIRRITFHGLRHSCASWLIYNDVDLKTIQTILGHSDFKMTSDIYSHIDMKQKKAALNKLTTKIF